jgi:hypothetical protein
MISTIFTVLASFVGIWAIFKYILLIEMRVDPKTFKTIYDLCKDQRKIILHEEFVLENRHPAVFSAFCFFKGAPWFYIDRNERLMQAGYHGKDHITMITCFRWTYIKLKKYLNLKLKDMQLTTSGVPVELMLPWSTDKIGSLKENPKEPVVEDYLWKDLDKEVEEVASGKRKKTSALLYGPPGNGKCLGKGTPVMLHTGHVVKVEEIKVGDKLMGPDSKPRTVLSLANGKETMYQIIPVKGDKYVVNESHVLSLKMNANADGYKTGDIVNISVANYLSMSNNFKHHAKGWRSPVNFPHSEVPLDPYFLGLWLGDGTSSKTDITTTDQEIVESIYQEAYKLGLIVSNTIPAGLANTYSITTGLRHGSRQNVLLDILRNNNLLNNKHIPDVYKHNSREVRLSFLAGLMDTDGSWNYGGFDYVSVSEKLADDVVYLSRSLGFAAYKKPCQKTCKNSARDKNFVGTYYRVIISGDLSVVPVKLLRKKCAPRRQIKNVLHTGITVKEIGNGEYYGFELDGDGLFLLGDFTVTHNTSCIKYLATKHRLPVMIFTLDPDWTNYDLLLLFSQIPNKCIVLFEDFDNYFDKRKCIMGGAENTNRSIKFTFDIILNGLDGVYNTYENVVFIMTVNDISKVDSALKNRPSRFKYVRLFGNPSLEVREKLLPKDWAEKSSGFNLDQIFRLKEYYELNMNFEEAISKLEKDFNKEDVEKVAYSRYLERSSLGIQATAEQDWNHAIEKLRSM